jgi:hypothetical protein
MSYAPLELQPQSMYQAPAAHLLLVLHSFYFSWQSVEEKNSYLS